MIHVEAHHVHILHEAEVISVHPQIAPVGVHDVPGQLGHFQRLFQHRVHRVGGSAQEVGEVLLHILAVHLTGSGSHVLAGSQSLGAQVKESLHRGPASGNQPLHLVGKGLTAAGQGGVNGGFAIAGGGDNPEIIRHHVPGNVQPVVVDDGEPAAAGIILAAKLAQLMKGGLKLKAASAEAGGHAARQVVLLHQQGLFPGQSQAAGRGQPAVSGADNNGVKSWHNDSSLHCIVVLPILLIKSVYSSPDEFVNYFTFFPRKISVFSNSQLDRRAKCW